MLLPALPADLVAAPPQVFPATPASAPARAILAASAALLPVLVRGKAVDAPPLREAMFPPIGEAGPTILSRVIARFPMARLAAHAAA